MQFAALKEYWKDDARYVRFVKGLRALGPTVHRSTSAMMRLVVAGEYSIAEPALLIDLMREKEKGSPIEYARTAAPIVSPRYCGIYEKSPHLNAAKLFSEWMVSPYGQAAIDSVGREVSRQGFPAKVTIKGTWPDNIKPILLTDKTFFEDTGKWLETYVKPYWEGK